MAIIQVSNNPVIVLPKTSLTANVSTAGTALTVANNEGFVANDYILIGSFGDDTSEIRKISTVATGFTINVDALEFNHPKGTPVSKILFNQVKVYRSATRTGTYELQATVDLETGSAYTEYIDSATGTVYFKTAYFNAHSSALSDYSDIIASTGYESNSLFNIRRRVAKYLGLSPEAVDLDLFLIFAFDGLNYIWTSAEKWRRDKKTVTFTTTASTYIYSLGDIGASDFDSLISLRYTRVDGSTTNIYRLTYKPEIEFDSLISNPDREDDDDLLYFTLREDTEGGDMLEVYPTPETGSLNLYFRYFAKPTAPTSLSDTVYVGNVNILALYITSMFELSRGNKDMSVMYQSMANQEIKKLKKKNRSVRYLSLKPANETDKYYNNTYDSSEDES
jgi:hypothetical protein